MSSAARTRGPRFRIALGLVVCAAGWALAQTFAGPKPPQAAQTQPSESAATQPARAGRPAARAAVTEAQERRPAPEALFPPTEPPPELIRAAQQMLVSGLLGSKHDFTHQGRVGRHLCLPCHTPHLLATPSPALDERAATLKPLQPYMGYAAELSGWSLLCLGCHDGVTAADVYATPHAIDVTGAAGNGPLGTRGLRSHPLGIAYPPAGTAGYNPLPAVEGAGLPLPNGTIQCTTCHDAHNTTRIPGMLRISNQRSQMCLTCHRL